MSDEKERAVAKALQAVANGIRTAKPRYWLGTIEQCQVCTRAIGDKMIDGAMHTGQWANMCKACHKEYGRGLGMGRGQEYTRQSDGRWLKTGG